MRNTKRATGRPKSIAPGLQASTVRRLLRTGMTYAKIAKMYGFCSGTALYNRFGSQITGIAKRGRPTKKVA